MLTFLSNGLIFSLSLLTCLLLAEGAIRLVDGLPLTDIDLPPAYSDIGRDTTMQHLDKVPLATGVARDWFFIDPRPLPNRRAVPEQWLALDRQMDARLRAGSRFRPEDMFKAWNVSFLGNPCDKDFLADAPRRLFVFDPPHDEERPQYRYLPNATTPKGLVTNDFGWRGPPLRFARSERTVRIVFAGASVVAGAHQWRHAFPEPVEHWLNLWAAAHWPNVRFEVMNAARESLDSTAIEAVVRQEVAPVHPDLVVYYEGANQFNLTSLVKNLPTSMKPPTEPSEGVYGWLQRASKHFALARRVQSLIGAAEPSTGELPKPQYEIRWPAGLDEADPDLRHPELPVQLGTILSDLDRIRADLARVDSEFALSSYVWMVKDGMILQPKWNRLLWEDINLRRFPFRYRDIERLVAFENRVFAKYAAEHRLPFLDIAGRMPLDPDLFSDAIHTTEAGMRLMAWIVLQELVPIVDKRLASGAWPKPVPAMSETHPAFTKAPREMTFTCK